MKNNEHEIKIISFGDTKTVVNKDGDEEQVNAYIPTCCREGWESCPHVVGKKKKIKRNVGL